MKITHHKDGSYSITGMTRDDIDDIGFAAGLACSWFVQNQGMLATADEWNDNREREFETLANVMADACRWSGCATDVRYLPVGRSIELDSTVWMGNPGRWAIVKDGRQHGADTTY